MASVHSNGTSWQAVVTLPGGRTVRLGVGGKAKVTREQAQAAADGVEAAAVEAADLHARPTVRACVDLWLGHREWAPLTLTSHRRITDGLCSILHGMRAADVTALDLARWRASVPGCEATRCKASRVVRALFRWLHDAGVVERNPARSLRGRAPMTPPEEKYTPTTLGEVLEAAHAVGTQAECLCYLIMLTGMRRGEAVRLRWDDVLEDRIIVRTERGVEGSKQRHRTVRLEPMLRAHLRHMQADGVLPCGMLTRSLSNAGRLITLVGERMGKPLTANAMRRWRANEWRRTYPDFVVNAWLGHTEAVARSTYLTPTEDYYRA
jgi:integrase